MYILYMLAHTPMYLIDKSIKEMYEIMQINHLTKYYNLMYNLQMESTCVHPHTWLRTC